MAPAESGALSFPSGCSYSNETRQAVFNRNRAGSSFGDLTHNYRHVCASDEADMKLVAGHSKPKPHKATHAASAAPICPKPAKWCVHVGATNEPQHCDGVPGHFCHDVYGKSGFKPCDEKITPTWGHVKVPLPLPLTLTPTPTLTLILTLTLTLSLTLTPTLTLTLSLTR